MCYYVEDREADFIHKMSKFIGSEPRAAIAPLVSGKVVFSGEPVAELTWYDNELGYVSTLIRHVEKVAGLIGN